MFYIDVEVFKINTGIEINIFGVTDTMSCANQFVPDCNPERVCKPSLGRCEATTPSSLSPTSYYY